MAQCDDCGGRSLTPVLAEGIAVLECTLCGALAGDDRAVSQVLLAREARERGIDPIIYPLARALDKVMGLRVIRADAGDAQARAWPFVQMVPVDSAALRGIENLVKSIALSAQPGELHLHWVVEVEFPSRLVLTLKPRFHRRVAEVTAELVATARLDLERLRRNLERDMGLSWWD